MAYFFVGYEIALCDSRTCGGPKCVNIRISMDFEINANHEFAKILI